MIEISSNNAGVTRPFGPAPDYLCHDKSRNAVKADSVKPINASASTPVVLANHAVSFMSDDATGRDYFVIRDKNTDKIIRQFPPEEVIKVARYLLEKGDLFNKKV